MRTLLSSVAVAAVLMSACGAQGQQAGSNAPGGGAREQSKPREEATARGAPVEAGERSVPEFKPAFPEQTRAPAVKTRARLAVTEVASGFNKPWAIAFLPDGRLLVTEKPTGKLFIVTPQGQKSAAVTGLPAVDGRDQGGLLDVEVARDFASSRMIYWTYSEPRQGGNGLAVARGKLTEGAAPKVEAVQVIFRVQPTLDSTKHSGGRLAWAADGKLFVTMGERSILPGRVQAQDLGSDFGKIVRINADGSIPRDNPFVGKAGARPELWSSGHRNVLGVALDRQGRLWTNEMGPRGGDELNRTQAAKDYGWPTISYGEEYSGQPIGGGITAQGDLQQPVYYWDPVISPSSMAIYSGTLFPEWRDNVFIGGLSSKALVRLVMNGDRVVGEERLLTDRGDRIREVVQGPDGALWLLTDATDGKVLRVAPAA